MKQQDGEKEQIKRSNKIYTREWEIMKGKLKKTHKGKNAKRLRERKRKLKYIPAFNTLVHEERTERHVEK